MDEALGAKLKSQFKDDIETILSARMHWLNFDYNGRPMPPPEAVAGTYRGPDGKPVKIEPLSKRHSTSVRCALAHQKLREAD